MIYVRNVTAQGVCAIPPGQAAQVDAAHRAVAAALAAGHLVPTDEPTPVTDLRAENARLKARVAELEGLLSLATEPATKPTGKRVAREG